MINSWRIIYIISSYIWRAERDEMYDEVIIYDTILNFFRFEKEIYLSLITRCHSRFLCGKFLFLDYVLFCHHKGFVLGLISSFSREKISMYFPLNFFPFEILLKAVSEVKWIQIFWLSYWKVKQSTGKKNKFMQVVYFFHSLLFHWKFFSILWYSYFSHPQKLA